MFNILGIVLNLMLYFDYLSQSAVSKNSIKRNIRLSKKLIPIGLVLENIVMLLNR